VKKGITDNDINKFLETIAPGKPHIFSEDIKIDWVSDDDLKPNTLYMYDSSKMVINKQGPKRTAEYKDSRMPGIYECVNCGFRSYDTHAFYFVQHATFEAMCIPCNNKREKNVRVLLEDYDVAMSR
jgi:hypothetical protein